MKKFNKTSNKQNTVKVNLIIRFVSEFYIECIRYLYINNNYNRIK